MKKEHFTLLFQVKKILVIPDEVCVVELMTIGYPKIFPEPILRKNLEEIVMYEEWNG